MMALQEHSLYEDSPRIFSKAHHHGSSSNMFLDLKRNKPSILSTPDVSVFALSTPEVHNLLSTAGNNTSITSVHYSPSSLRGTAAETHPGVTTSLEQEYYAKGFLDRFEACNKSGLNAAVDSLCSAGGYSTTSAYCAGPNPSLEAVAPTYVTATLDHIPNFAAATQTTSESTASYPVSSQHDVYYSESYSMPTAFRHHEAAMMPTGYPMLAATGGVAVQPMYSIMDTHINSDVLKEMTMVPDLHTQEQMKTERKKARNRIAASKCRTRRLQREADLEGKVKYLKDHNKELNNEVNGLKEQISSLKKALMQHVNTGCQIDIPASSSEQ